MSDSVRPRRQPPIRLPRPWDSPGKNTGVGCHFLLQRMKVKSESEVAQSCLTLSDPMDCSPPGFPVHGISRQEYWSEVPVPSPPGGTSGKESACQGRRHKKCELDPWVGKIPLRRTWQPTPVFLTGKFHGQRSLVGYSPWGRKRVRHSLATKQQ